MLQEDQIKLKCLELAIASGDPDTVDTANRYYDFIMGKVNAAKNPPPHDTKPKVREPVELRIVHSDFNQGKY